MKPLGTITMYYHFVDIESKNILESILEASYNYHDFTSRLVEWVCSQESSDELVLLAAIHMSNLGDFRIFERLREIHYRTPIAHPYFLYGDARYDEDPSGFERAKSAIEAVLSAGLDDWVALQFYRLFSYVGGALGRFDPHKMKAIEKMKDFIENNDSLDCFKPSYLTAEASLSVRKDYLEAARTLDQARKHALKFDDQVFVAQALNMTAACLRNHDRTRALQLVSQAEQLADKLGLSSAVYSSIMTRRQIHSARGEYSAVIDLNQDLIQLREKGGVPTLSEVPHSIAVTLNEIGESEDALEWGRMALDTIRSGPWAAPLPYFDVARSLIQLGQLDEARTYMDKAKEILLKTGDEFFLLVEYYVDGLLEMAEGHLQDAMQSFERSLEVCERIERQRRINQALCSLVECEVALFERTSENESDDCSGAWMERLEEEIEEKDIPGIEGRLLLLKAKLRMKQGRKEEAETLLNDVRRLAENPHVRYLAEWVAELRAQARAMEL
ncbi:MAG: hypothetical protein ACXADC_07030 [Candidatus Thorarchaeota archaeon]|jgi:tetratricopeptide (TPR) repeat protein